MTTRLNDRHVIVRAGLKSSALCLLLAAILWPGAVCAAEPESMTLRQGGKQIGTFTLKDPQAQTLLWVRGRIVLPDGEQAGAHVLRLKVNGTALTPNNVRVLNKAAIFDKPGTVVEDPRRRGRETVTSPNPIDL